MMVNRLSSEAIRCARVSLPLPVLAGSLGRFVYVRIYPKLPAKDDEN